MSYTLQAIVAKSGAFSAQLPQGLKIVRLRGDLEMLPLTTGFRDVHDIPFCSLTYGGDSELPPALLSLCERLSKHLVLAYIEAEYFGGNGSQAHALFAGGEAVCQPVMSKSAINDALRYLGVTKGDARDEFEAVGLGHHRNTDKWVS